MRKNLVFMILALIGTAVIACTHVGDGGAINDAEPTSAKSKLGEPDNSLLSGVIKSSGLERSFLLYRPAALEKTNKPGPVVFALHGSTGSGEVMRTMVGAGFEKLADEKGFVVVYPDGYERHWNDCRGSADYAANTENIDDPTFFADLIADLTEKNIIDPEQAFVTGLSNGGQMAFRLAMERPELFKAYAAVIASLPEESYLDCTRSNTPVSMMIMNGSEDPINPYKGGVVSIRGNDSRGEVSSSRETALYWAGLAGNRRPPVTTSFPESDGDPKTSITEKRWEKGNGYRISLVTMHGSGHVFPVPGAALPPEYEKIVGPAAGDIDGSAEIIRFFFAD